MTRERVDFGLSRQTPGNCPSGQFLTLCGRVFRDRRHAPLYSGSGKVDMKIMREFKRGILAFLFMASLTVALFLLCVGSFDGILYGHWPEIEDHPANWLETDLHP